VKSYQFLVFFALASAHAHAFVATNNQEAVNVRIHPDDPRKAIVKGATYTMVVDSANGWIEKFTAGGEELIGEHPLCPIINSGKVNGPGRIEIVQTGSAVCELRITDLWWTDLDAEIQIVLNCFKTRVNAEVRVDVRGASRDFALGWYGSATYAMHLIQQPGEIDEKASFQGRNPSSVVTIAPPEIQFGMARKSAAWLKPPLRISTNYGYEADFRGTRTAGITILAQDSHEALKTAVLAEGGYRNAAIKVDAGTYQGYLGNSGCFDIALNAPISKPVRISVVNPLEKANVTTASDYYFRVRGAGAPFSVCDASGFPLPVSVQQSMRNQESWFSLPVTPGEQQTIVLLPHGKTSIKLKTDGAALATERNGLPSFRYLLHDRLYPQSSGFVILPQAKTDYITAARYQTDSGWLKHRLNETGQYLDSPLLTNIGATYESQDGQLMTTLEVFEPAQSDATRTYIKFVVEARDTVVFAGDSARSLRLFEARGAAWGSVTFVDESDTIQQEMITPGEWTLEGQTLAPSAPFVAAMTGEGDGIGWLINRVTGTIGGQPLSQLALSAADEGGEPTVFLTVPGITELTKGDRIEAHLFIMPIADATPDLMSSQRAMYGAGLARIEARTGTAAPGYPRRVRIDARNFAEFTITGGSQQTPIIVDGFPANKSPLLWEQTHEGWRLLNEAPNWHHVFLSSDNTFSAVFLLDLMPDTVRSFVVTHATGIEGLEHSANRVMLRGSQMSFGAPLAPTGIEAVPIEGTSLFACTARDEVRVN